MQSDSPFHADPVWFEIPTGRRRAIATLGMGGLAMALSTGHADAFLNRRGKEEPTVTVQTGQSGAAKPAHSGYNASSLPSEWVRRQGRNLDAYANFIDSLRLRTIRTHDVIAAHSRKRGDVWNEIPPRQWWRRMGYTLRVVERVALEMNEPVTEIVSAYRTPAYNSRCGGRRGSWHQANLALDVRMVSRPARVAAVTRHLRDLGMFKGGVGSYRNFTHIDARGQNINW